PVLSIMTEDRDLLSNGLYSRSYGRSPGEVLGYTMTYLRALQGTGCLGCAKHFPGIGAGEVDSHEEMPIIHLSHEDLIAQDLAPYIELFQREDNMVRAVMVSHGGFPNIDIHRGIAGGRLVPASINFHIVTRLLRDELGYRGLVLTDDMEMGAIAKHNPIEDSALRAVEAGEDMLLICATPALIRRGYDALVAAARAGRLSPERIEVSLRRIAAFKSLAQPPHPFDPHRLEQLSLEVAELNRKLNYVYGGKI
ncbi:MAG TPA: glycoside hydrolase family 3 N-terminal domain-containing protein, partial [Pyrinomonadaceae bacterium]|nr:glycoside hydrolase family 3 N-terminal domain-containing protein [Pyrinomonadaceae bacterium]